MFGLFRRKSVVDAVIDPDKGHLSKIGKFIGNQQFTDQEKAVMNAGLAAEGPSAPHPRQPW